MRAASKQYVRIRLLESQDEEDEQGQRDWAETGQWFDYEVISGGYLPEMDCISEKYGDKWTAVIPTERRYGFVFEDIAIYPLGQVAQVRRLEPGEVLRSLRSYPPTDFLEREAIEAEQAAAKETYRERYENWRKDLRLFPSHTNENPSVPTRIEMQNFTRQTETCSGPYRLLSGSLRENLQLRSEQRGDRWIVRTWSFHPNSGYQISLRTLDAVEEIQDPASVTEVEFCEEPEIFTEIVDG